MTLSEAVTKYVAQRDFYEAERAQYINLRDVLSPAAKQSMTDAESAKKAAELNIKTALSLEDIETFKDDMSTSESNFKSATLLYDNIVTKMKSWETNNSTWADEVSRLKAQVWRIKQRELMEAFAFDEPTLTKLEKIIVAGHARDPGFVSTRFSVPIDEKYGSLDDKERVDELQTQMETEMGIA